MGFKSATQSNSSKYIVNNLIFSSKREYLNAKRINKKLKLLYSPAPSGSLWPTIKYSSARDDEEEFNSILDKVEELLTRFDEDTKLRIGDGNFNQKFLGIVDFLYEAGDLATNREDELSKQIPEYIKKRFISISDKLMDYCVLVEF